MLKKFSTFVANTDTEYAIQWTVLGNENGFLIKRSEITCFHRTDPKISVSRERYSKVFPSVTLLSIKIPRKQIFSPCEIYKFEFYQKRKESITSEYALLEQRSVS